MSTPLSTEGDVQEQLGDSKSARLAALYTKPRAGARLFRSFAEVRDILRSDGTLQGGVGGDVLGGDATQLSVFFLDGEPHRKRRAAIARFFTPKAIATRYRAVIEASTDQQIAILQVSGRARLDELSFQLAVDVAAVTIGLTNSNSRGMARRIRNTLDNGIAAQRAGILARGTSTVKAVFHALSFLASDVLPALLARRKARREDVISHLLDERYSLQAILLECLTYAAAGMITTREFIVVAAWHLFERDDLRARFLAGDDNDQIALLEEILRVEPVATMLHRQATRDLESGALRVEPGEICALDLRAANMDESVTGPCPHLIDPDRARKMKAAGSYMSFGDGRHRCPGAQLALHESRIFLDRLFRLPGISLENPPEMIWRPELMSYEVRNAVVTCSRA